MRTTYPSSITSMPPAFSRVDEASLDVVGARALDLSEQRYSSGFPLFRGGKEQVLGFNNRRHGEMVGTQAAHLARYEGFSHLEQRLAKVAGYAHDVVQLKGRGIDERESAQWLQEQLARVNVPKEIGVMLSESILATLPLFTDGIVSDQMVNHMKFSSKRSHHLAQCITSADMGEIYTPAGPYLSHLLYLQRRGIDATQAPAHFDDLADFQRRQLLFLESYTYPLPSAIGLFATHHKEVLEYGGFVVSQLEDGKIESWDQLMRQDMAFMRTPTKSPFQLLAK